MKKLIMLTLIWLCSFQVLALTELETKGVMNAYLYYSKECSDKLGINKGKAFDNCLLKGMSEWVDAAGYVGSDKKMILAITGGANYEEALTLSR